MSHFDSGGWQPRPAPGPPTPDAPQQTLVRRWWPLAALLAVACALAGALAVMVWPDADDKRTEVDFPSAWNPRVQSFADAVEKERGLEFQHPVYVDFLTRAKFQKKVTADEQEITDEDRAELKQDTSMFRALGLVEGRLDLFDSMNTLNRAGIVGYYSYEDQRIRVRGKKLTPAVRSTLVHELTHALQDQHFNLGWRMENLKDDSTASGALRAIAEGDARRIETEWRKGLSKKQAHAVATSMAQQSQEAKKGLHGVPKVFETMMASPYVFGEALLRVAIEEGGESAVDNLFRSPPSTDEQQIDPWTLVADQQGYLDVEEPTLGDGEKAFDDGPFGSLAWLLVLSERIPVEQAVTAVDGWGGDAYVAFERDGVSCVRMNYAGDNRSDLEQMNGALTAWVKRVPGGPASVRRDGQRLLFESCDPGTRAASVATGGSTKAVKMVLTRTYLSIQLKNTGMPTSVARCSADRLVRAFTTAELNDPAVAPRVPGVIAPCVRA